MEDNHGPRPYVQITMDVIYQRLTELITTVDRMNGNLVNMADDIKDHEDRIRKSEGQKATIVSFLAMAVAVGGIVLPIVVPLISKG